MKSLLVGEDPLSKQPKVQIGKNLVSFFGESIPPFPSPSGDIDSLFKLRLYNQASGLADKLLPSTPVPGQLNLLTIKIASLLSIKAVPSAIAAVTNYFGSADLSDLTVWKGFEVPVKLRVLCCLAHHFNGDSHRALSSLYRVLKSTTVDDTDLVIITLAKLQSTLGDFDEVLRLLDKPRFEELRNHLLQIAGIFASPIGGFAAMAAGDYSRAVEEFQASGETQNEAIAAFYNCQHSRSVDLLEACIKRDPVQNTNPGLLNNLFAVYGFYKESFSERKISTINEVTKFYCPEAAISSSK
jgi:hypothetical protein